MGRDRTVSDRPPLSRPHLAHFHRDVVVLRRRTDAHAGQGRVLPEEETTQRGKDETKSRQKVGDGKRADGRSGGQEEGVLLSCNVPRRVAILRKLELRVPIQRRPWRRRLKAGSRRNGDRDGVSSADHTDWARLALPAGSPKPTRRK